jgi:hypothetical protein
MTPEFQQLCKQYVDYVKRHPEVRSRVRDQCIDQLTDYAPTSTEYSRLRAIVDRLDAMGSTVAAGRCTASPDAESETADLVAMSKAGLPDRGHRVQKIVLSCRIIRATLWLAGSLIAGFSLLQVDCSRWIVAVAVAWTIACAAWGYLAGFLFGRDIARMAKER